MTIEDDAFVRQLVAAGVDSAEIIEDQRQKRQVPIVVDVLVVGGGQKLSVYHRLPAQPPSTLDQIYLCNAAEIVRFTERHDWLRTVLAAVDAPTDQLLISALCAPQPRPAHRINGRRTSLPAGRELAKLLALDLARLDGVLRGVR